MNAIQAYYIEHLPSSSAHDLERLPRIECNDGFTLSVQASSFHYCSPRADRLPNGAYIAWEIGFPSAVEPLLFDWIEDPSDPTGTVYGYVPTSTVNEVLAKHGGIKGPLAGN